MNKKIKTIIFISILGVLGIVYGVFYILNPENTKKVTESVFDYICNKPLPVIGISILTLGFITLRVIQVTGIGKKSLSECREELKEAREQREKSHAELLSFEEKFDQKLDKLENDNNDKMRQICVTIPNKKVNELGEEFYGKREERINSNPEEE